jgi:hypothetical protein
MKVHKMQNQSMDDLCPKKQISKRKTIVIAFLKKNYPILLKNFLIHIWG